MGSILREFLVPNSPQFSELSMERQLSKSGHTVSLVPNAWCNCGRIYPMQVRDCVADTSRIAGPGGASHHSSFHMSVTFLGSPVCLLNAPLASSRLCLLLSAYIWLGRPLDHDSLVPSCLSVVLGLGSHSRRSPVTCTFCLSAIFSIRLSTNRSVVLELRT